MLECTVTAFRKRARTPQLADAFMKIDSEGLITFNPQHNYKMGDFSIAAC